MKNSIFGKFYLSLIILTLLAATNIFAQDNPVAWTLKVDSAAKSFKAGDTFNVQVSAQIKDGWHLYSTTKLENGPIATSISLEEGQPFEMAGGIKSPDPIVTFDPNFNLDTEYYEKFVIFTLTVKVLPNISASNNKLKLQTRYQSCTPEMCLPPKLEKLEVVVEFAGITNGVKTVQPKAVGVKAVTGNTSHKTQVADFSFTDFTGKPRKFSEFKGKVVLLDFWATWCSPCLADIPKLKVLYDKYKSQGFEIIGMDSETIGEDEAPDAEFAKETAARAKQIVKTRGAIWTQATTETAVPIAKNTFGVKALPTKILIDKDGNIVARIGEKDDLEKAIVALMEAK
ncbi:MAG TPA: protein-disulfide reductase DsbD family protein [Pyrinomonadaceae bacterium]|nr:protein-disulfide reductase DsbD family protein [Pyrinomonadaceae bacterium]